MDKKISLISSGENWIEGEAIRQLENTAALPGMVKAVGLPDLHPGKGHPIGAVFASTDIIYPYLIGNDIGCGMAFFQTTLRKTKTKQKKLDRRLHGLEIGIEESDAIAILNKNNLSPAFSSKTLGTIGGGNHFVELQQVVSIHNNDAFAQAGLSEKYIYILVHTGSRGLGEIILRRHVDQFKADGLNADSIEAQDYIKSHDNALHWANVNRLVIGQRIMDMINAEGERILDLPHNLLSHEEVGKSKYWLHRKGAAPVNHAACSNSSKSNLLIIPGSRGTLTYLVQFTGAGSLCLNSVAHGAGRKWNRRECKGRLRSKFSYQTLQKTEIGSHVICEDKELIYEEAPQAYKKIEHVIASLTASKLVKIVATMAPVLTYKKRVHRSYV